MSWAAITLPLLRHQSRCALRFSSLLQSQRRAVHASERLRKSRNSFASEPAPGTSSDVPVINTKGKGPKGAFKTSRGARTKRGDLEESAKEEGSRYASSTKNQGLPGESFEEGALKANMQRAVQRCKDAISQKVTSHGRADPALLDSIQITFTPPGTPTGESTSGSTSTGKGGGMQTYPLKDFASVGVKDGALIVTCYDSESVKQVERALYASNIGLVPQHVSGAEGVLRLPVPRPTAESRAELVKDVNRICENAKISIRTARHEAQKQIKNDEKRKVISKDEGVKEMKKMEEETKRQSAEVDQICEKTKKRLEQG